MVGAITRKSIIGFIAWIACMFALNVCNGWQTGEALRKIEYDAKVAGVCYTKPVAVFYWWTITPLQSLALASVQPLSGGTGQVPWFRLPWDQDNCAMLEALLKR